VQSAMCLIDTKVNSKHYFRPFTGDCRILRFKPAVEGFFLQGHVLKSFTVQTEIACEIKCFVEHGCVSYNFEPSDEDGIYICELSQSDHKMHPRALARRNGSTYRATEVDFIKIRL